MSKTPDTKPAANPTDYEKAVHTAYLHKIKSKTDSSSPLQQEDISAYRGFLIECMKENLNHARHIENERHNFLSLHLVVVGLFLGTIISPDTSPWFSLLFSIILLMFSSIMAELFKRWARVYQGHMDTAQRMARLIDNNGNDVDVAKFCPTLIDPIPGRHPNFYYYFDNNIGKVALKGHADAARASAKELCDDLAKCLSEEAQKKIKEEKAAFKIKKDSYKYENITEEERTKLVEEQVLVDAWVKDYTEPKLMDSWKFGKDNYVKTNSLYLRFCHLMVLIEVMAMLLAIYRILAQTGLLDKIAGAL